MNYQIKAAVLVACLLAIGVASTPQNALAQDFCYQQSALPRPIPLGVSGGNIKSTIKFKKSKGCFSGTLGSMVQDGDGVQYILSNNHVLADINQAKPGQMIVQPGKIDTAPVCLRSSSDAVATFSRTVKIEFGSKTNDIDAAIAAVDPGAVSSEILNIGEISTSTVAPVVGMPVQKMGRTTCLTLGAVEALDVNISVNYSDTGTKLAKFVNQILITGQPANGGGYSEFGGPGDSGSLIVTNNQGCPEAVALLFAGGSDGSFTIGNPIDEVLSELSVTMVGSCVESGVVGASQADVEAQNVGVSAAVVKSAASVRDRHEDKLMHIPGAVGTGIAAGDQPGVAAIEIYLSKLTPQAQAAAPAELEGLPVKLVQTGEIGAY
jgi:hypothetical protein